MPRGWRADKPKTDDGYFERMNHAIFQAGLNWSMIEKKWPNFEKAFAGFSVSKVAGFNEAKVKALMSDPSIVRNEKKIRSSIANAKEFLSVKKEFGSFQAYLDSFKKDEEGLISDLQKRFRHLGESSSRMYLYMVGKELTPTKEEKRWLSGHAEK